MLELTRHDPGNRTREPSHQDGNRRRPDNARGDYSHFPECWPILVGAVLLAAVVLGCYLCAPVAYDLTSDQFTVRFRLGEKVFAPVTRRSLLSSRPPWGLRLCLALLIAAIPRFR
jgi:hypothetical protein